MFGYQVGFFEVEDMAGTSWRQLFKLSPSVPKLTADLTEKALPVKFAKIHIVNESKIVDALYQLMKPLISQQLRQRLVFHGQKLAKLHEVVPLQQLPAELGGNWTPQAFSDEQIDQLNCELVDYWNKYPVN